MRRTQFSTGALGPFAPSIAPSGGTDGRRTGIGVNIGRWYDFFPAGPLDNFAIRKHRAGYCTRSAKADRGTVGSRFSAGRGYRAV
jgi:hypothetical protein